MSATAIAPTELTIEQIAELKHTFIGPTWSRTSNGKLRLPRLTLGWHVAQWCMENLSNPNGDGMWRFTDEQLRFVLWWYAIDERGVFAYRTGVLQRMKGW